MRVRLEIELQTGVASGLASGLGSEVSQSQDTLGSVQGLMSLSALMSGSASGHGVMVTGSDIQSDLRVVVGRFV